MKCKLLKKSVNLVLVLAFFVSSSFAEVWVTPIPMSYQLTREFEKLKEKYSGDQRLYSSTTMEISFYPENRDSNNIDCTFFHNHCIKYYTSQSLLIAYVPLPLIQEMREIITGVDYIDVTQDARPQNL